VGLDFSRPVVYLSILIIAVCGIIYELIIGAVSSYLWGDSIYYFSVTIGLYMSAMGLGAFFSKFLHQKLFDWFVLSEILVGLIGGSSALFLFWAYSSSDYYEYAFVGVTVVIGMLVGVEIPLLIRILENQDSLRQNVAHVLSYDYIGGLIGALAFPVLLLPHLGLIRTALVLGCSNILVAALNFIRHKRMLKKFPLLLLCSALTTVWLGIGLWQTPDMQHALEQRLYRDKVVVSLQTPYQQLTVTEWHKDIRLFINGGLQFSSLDEYRYHESLVHVPMSTIPEAKSVLVLGGGDGLAVRELLKYPHLEDIVLIDIDPDMIRLFQNHSRLRKLNQDSLSSSRLTIKNLDAYKFAESDPGFYDLIIVDLPDPSNTGLSKLYSREFYELLKRRLSQRGTMVVQSTSPFFAPEAYWCIHKTLLATQLQVYPYQVDVPSFGNWGFQMVSRRSLDLTKLTWKQDLDTRFLNEEMLNAIFVLPKDMTFDLTKLEINSMMQPVLLKYYKQGWNGIR